MDTSLTVAVENLSLDTIRTIEDLDALLKAVTAIKDAEKVYINAKLFREKAIAYAQLEAAALVRVVELGGENKLKKGKLRDAAIWLAKMGEAERNHYIRMCQSGKTIDNIYWQIVGEKEEKEAYRDFGYTQRDKLVEEVKATGKVDIGAYAAVLHKKLGAEGRDIVNGTREALRNAGGVCVDDGSHIYIKDTSDDKDGIKGSIRVRIRSIRHDYLRILEILAKSKTRIEYEDILGDLYGYSNEWGFAKNPFALLTVLSLECANTFSNPEDLHRVFTENDGENLAELFLNNPILEQFVEEAHTAIQNLHRKGKVA